MNTVVKYWPLLWSGMLTTLTLCVIGWVFGIVLGLIVGICASRFTTLAKILRRVSFCFTALPILIVMVWLHYPAQALLGIVVDPFYTSAFCITLYNSLSVASLTQQVANDFPRHYLEIADGLGIPQLYQLKEIILPILLRQIIPSLLPLQVQVLHLTMFASLISVDELFRMTQRIITREFDPVGLYTLLASLYLGISLPLLMAAEFLRKRFSRELLEG